MASVVLLRGVNVGGARVFRPAQFVTTLKGLDVVNIGAAGTFVVRDDASTADVQAIFAKKLPFDTEIMVVDGKAMMKLAAKSWFDGQPDAPDYTRFLSVLATTPKKGPTMPLHLPSEADWTLRLLAREGRFVIGLYKRHMQAVSQLGRLDTLFGTPATTRNWNTVQRIVKTLGA